MKCKELDVYAIYRVRFRKKYPVIKFYYNHDVKEWACKYHDREPCLINYGWEGFNFIKKYGVK